MVYTLDTPITIGDLEHQITISQLQLASVSFNFQKFYKSSGTAICTIILEDPNSGHTFSFTFNDAASLSQWVNFDGAQNLITKAVFNRLESAGKIPSGTLA